jgi:hypothetical protein
VQTWSGPRQKRKDKSQRQLQAGFGACARQHAHEKHHSEQQNLRKQPKFKKGLKIGAISPKVQKQVRP